MSSVFRYVEPDTAVCRGEKRHRVAAMRKTFPLDRWACVLVNGRDTAGVNKVVRADELLARQPVDLARSTTATRSVIATPRKMKRA
jgi:hypothetical protein